MSAPGVLIAAQPCPVPYSAHGGPASAPSPGACGCSPPNGGITPATPAPVCCCIGHLCGACTPGSFSGVPGLLGWGGSCIPYAPTYPGTGPGFTCTAEGYPV